MMIELDTTFGAFHVACFLICAVMVEESSESQSDGGHESLEPILFSALSCKC